MKLLAFLSCQSNTIARLRVRNIRLRNRIQILTTQMDNIRASTHTNSLRDATNDQADVLVDIQSDATFFAAPSHTPLLQMDHLYPPEIKSELATQNYLCESELPRRTLDVLRLWCLSFCHLHNISYTYPSSGSQANLWVLLYR